MGAFASMKLWEELKGLKQNLSRGEGCLVGDFNAVSCVEERNGRNGGSSMQEISEFNNFIVDMELFDVPVLGQKFSWLCSDGISMSRLDRFLISDGLIDLWGVTGQWIGSRDISYHCPIWLLRANKDWGPKPFRVFNAWFEHEDFLPFVKDCWTSFAVSGPKAFVVKEKFKLLKERLRKWNKEVFGVLDLNIEALVRDINALDQVLAEGWDGEVVVKRKEVSANFWKEIHLRESMMSQKSRARWIKEGDMNSRYFHSLMNFRRRWGKVLLLDVNGGIVEEVEEVKEGVKRHLRLVIPNIYIIDQLWMAFGLTRSPMRIMCCYWSLFRKKK